MSITLDESSLTAVPRAVRAKYGLVSDGEHFVFQGAFVEVAVGTPEQCVAQINQLKTVDEVCILVTDPVIVIAGFEEGPVAIRTKLASSSAQELVDRLNPQGDKLLDSGKICVVRFR